MFRQETNNVHVSKDNKTNLSYLHYVANCYLDIQNNPEAFEQACEGLSGTEREHFELIADLLCYAHSTSPRFISVAPYVAIEHQIKDGVAMGTVLVFRRLKIIIRSHIGEGSADFSSIDETVGITGKRYRLRPAPVDESGLRALLSLGGDDQAGKMIVMSTQQYLNNLSVELSGKTNQPREPKHQIQIL